jgi:hypothetical protein
MAADVLTFTGETKLPVPVDRVLRQALEEHEQNPFGRVIVIAIYEAGMNEYYAASESDASTHVWDMQRFTRYLHARADERLIPSSD